MPRKRREARVRHRSIPLTSHTLFILSTGFDFFNEFPDEDALQEFWQEHRETILSLWARCLPGYRPFGWWRFEGGGVDGVGFRADETTDLAHLESLRAISRGERSALDALRADPLGYHASVLEGEGSGPVRAALAEAVQIPSEGMDAPALFQRLAHWRGLGLGSENHISARALGAGLAAHVAREVLRRPVPMLGDSPWPEHPARLAANECVRWHHDLGVDLDALKLPDSAVFG